MVLGPNPRERSFPLKGKLAVACLEAKGAILLLLLIVEADILIQH